MKGYSGAVLAGGHSSRFGQDKARYIYRGKPLLGWVLDSLSGAAERFVVISRPYPEFDVPGYFDIRPGADSLSGLHTALLKIRTDWTALAACDLPFLTTEYWAFMYALHEHAPVIMAQGPEGHPEPLAALYHHSVLAGVERQLDEGNYLMRQVMSDTGGYIIPWPVLQERFGPDLFTNANHLGDLP